MSSTYVRAVQILFSFAWISLFVINHVLIMSFSCMAKTLYSVRQASESCNIFLCVSENYLWSKWCNCIYTYSLAFFCSKFYNFWYLGNYVFSDRSLYISSILFTDASGVIALSSWSPALFWRICGIDVHEWRKGHDHS